MHAKIVYAPSMRALMVVGLLCAAGAAWADEADVHYRSGLTMKQQGRLDDAVGEFEKAIALRGDYAAAEFSLGLILRQKRPEKAVPHLEKAARLEPKSAEMHSALGIAYHLVGRADDAVRELEKACELNPVDSIAHQRLGVI